MSDLLRRSVPALSLSQEEAAEALGISVDSFEKHVKHDLPVVHVGRRRVYSVSALQAWLDRNQLRGGRRAA